MQSDVSGDVIWTSRGLHHHVEVVSGPALAARPSTARQYVAVDALMSDAAVKACNDAWEHFVEDPSKPVEERDLDTARAGLYAALMAVQEGE